MSSHAQLLSAQQKRALLASLVQADEVEHSRAHDRLSFAQERIWFVEQLQPAGTTHSLATALRLSGPVERQALADAFTQLVERHEVLRTTYARGAVGPVALVADGSPCVLHVTDLTHSAEETRLADVHAAVQNAAAERIDIAAAPVARLHLVVIGPEDNVLILVVHHIACDGVSMQVLIDELGVLYSAATGGRDAGLRVPDLQYADFAEWQRRAVDGDLREDLRWWTRALEGAPPFLELPSDRARPAAQDVTGGSVTLPLPDSLMRAVRALAAQEHTTPFCVLLAALAVVIHRYTGQEDFCIGLPVSGRTEVATERMVGLLVNTVPLRVRVPGNQRFVELLRAVRRGVLDAQARQHVPFERLIEAINPPRSLAHSPLFQVMATAVRGPAQRHAFGPLACAAFTIRATTAPLDQTHFWIEDRNRTWWWTVEYQAALFDAARVWRMVEHGQRVLASAVGNPDARVAGMPMLTRAERDLLAGITGRPRTVPGAPVHELVSARAAAAPDAPAVVHEGGTLTYAELVRRARALARELQVHGVRPGDRVAVRLARGPELVAALLGVWHAGAAYVAVDPGHPEARVRLTMEDAAPRAVVQACPASGRAMVTPCGSAASTATSGAAYVCYTSGSTGRPKGVVVSHRALANVLNAFRDEPGFTSSDVLLAVTTIAFDIATLELFLPLVTGGAVAIAPEALLPDGEGLRAFAASVGATVIQATPATWRLLVDAGWDGTNPRLRAWTGGDTLPADLSEALTERTANAWNLYGPTETTIWSSVARLRRGVAPAIGRPIDNTAFRILDRAREAVPIGVPGELYITGAGLADGYWARPDLTAERFVALEDGTRAYRSGDVVRVRPSGDLEHLGRLDNQVKLRGFRIEPGEVEHVLASQPGVRECAVVVREDKPGDHRLVGYVVAVDGADLDTRVLHDALAAALPAYMVPQLLVLPSLPLTANRKLDRAALPRPATLEAAPPAQKPRDDVEQRIARIWEDILGLPSVGIEDDFFRLGGHSMLAVRVFGAIAAELGVSLPLSTLFHDPTVASLARAVREQRAGAQASLLVPLSTNGHRPPFFAGGSDPVYKQLAGLLGSDQPFYKMDLYARAEALVCAGRKPHAQFEEYVREFADGIRELQPHGPYKLGGGCDGGVLALAVARLLQDAGEDVALLVIWDTPRTGFFERSWARRARHLARRAGEAIRTGHLPARAPRPDASGEQLTPAEQMHLFIYNSYWAAIREFRHAAPFRGRIHFLEAEQQYEDMLPTATGWHELATRGVERHRIPGSHDSYAHEHLPHFAAALRRLLEQS